jgi:hypothetical protein
VKKAAGWLAVIGVLLGVGFGGDHLARKYVEGRAAAAVTAASGTSERVEVGLGGWPFSSAFLTTSVPQATLNMASLNTSFDGHQIALTDIEATSGTAQIDDAMLTASRVVGTAKMSYFGLGAFMGKSVTPAEDGRVKISSTIYLFGHQMTAAISAQPVLNVDTQIIRLDRPKLLLEDSSGDVELDLSSFVFAQFEQSLEIHLPGGFRLTSFTAGSEDIQVAFAADKVNVPLR